MTIVYIQNNHLGVICYLLKSKWACSTNESVVGGFFDLQYRVKIV